MKKNTYLSTLFAVLLAGSVQAQNVGIGTNNPNNSAKLEITANDRGVLIPRISIPNLNATAPVTSPVVSLLVYNTNTTSGIGYHYWSGTQWLKLLNQNDVDQDWYEVGTTTAPNSINDNIYTRGKVGIGLTNPTRSLDVDGSVFVTGTNLPDVRNAEVLFEYGRTYPTYNTAGIGDGAFRILFNSDEFATNGDGVVFEIMDGNQQYGDGGFLFRAQGANIRDSLNLLSLRSDNGFVGMGIKRALYTLHIHSTTTDGSRLMMEGDGLGFINAGLILQANTSTNGRGLGTFMFDKTARNEWFTGRPYAGSDRFVVQRLAGNTSHNDIAAAIIDGSGTATATQRFLTIENNGNTGIGLESPADRLHVNGHVRVGPLNPPNTGTLPSYGNRLYFSGGNTAATYNSDNSDVIFLSRYNLLSDQSELRLSIGDNSQAQDAFTIGYNSAAGFQERIRLQSDGNALKPGGGTWTATSDRRTKKEINPFTDGLQVLTQINPVTFQYNGLYNTTDDGNTHVGIIAQEVQEVAPYMIGSYEAAANNDGLGTEKILNYDGGTYMIYVLVNAVKQQQQLIEQQAEKHAAEKKTLEERLERLEKRLNKLEK
jgi:hypothetical protein